MCLICCRGIELVRAEDQYIKLYSCSICKDIRVTNKLPNIPFLATQATTISKPQYKVTIKDMLQTNIERGKKNEFRIRKRWSS